MREEAPTFRVPPQHNAAAAKFENFPSQLIEFWFQPVVWTWARAGRATKIAAAAIGRNKAVYFSLCFMVLVC
jgi:hypothetical protein